MEQCSNIGFTKIQQKRQVRIVIVFLQNILKLRVLHFDDISPSIKQFCMEHSGVKEAQDLLKEIISQANFPKETTPSGK